MSGIMGMAKGYEFGTVKEMKAEGGTLTFRSGAVKSACEGLFRAAAQLEKRQYLGLQVSVSGDGRGSLSIFASAWADVRDIDFIWIFRDCAEVGPRAENFAADLFEGGRHVYFLERFLGKQERSVFAACAEDDCRALYFMLKESGAVIRVIAEGGGFPEKGMIFISLPEKMSLYMRTVLSQSFPLTKVSALKDGEEPGRKVSEPGINFLIEGVEDLVWLFAVTQENEDTGEVVLPDFEPEYIEDLHLSLRTYNCLKRAGVERVDRLREMSDEELLNIRNFSEKCLREVRMKTGVRHVEERAEEAGAEQEVTAKPAKKPIEMLDELIGLEGVKAQVRRIAAFAEMQQDMRAHNLTAPSAVLHMEFVGNPGTAKTTVARILAGIFSEIGLIKSGEPVEVGRGDLVGQYIGHTAEKVREVFKKAKGRLLFIDEAYALNDDRENSFGDEAISAIVQEMENHRDETIVIFAGYPKQMQELFSRNPGLKSRVPFTIRFNDYSEEEMVRIAEFMSAGEGFMILPEAKEKVAAVCREALGQPACGNGRFCRNMVQNAIINYAGRMYSGTGAPADRRFALAAEDFHFPEELRKNGRGVTMGFRL